MANTLEILFARFSVVITRATPFVALMAIACVPVQIPEQSGFLSSYENLTVVDEHRLYYPGTKVGKYSAFIVDPIILVYAGDPENPRFTAEEIADLIDYFERVIVEELSRDKHEGPGYPIVETAGSGVARLRIGITDVEETVALLNILIYTKITGAGLGGAAAEGELIDSETGEQLAAFIRWGSGSRILHAGLTHTGDAKIAMHHWARELREWIDYAHGRTDEHPIKN